MDLNLTGQVFANARCILKKAEVSKHTQAIEAFHALDVAHTEALLTL